MSATKIFPFGTKKITLSANQKITLFTKGSAKLYKQVGYPNHPNTFDLETTVTNTTYLSSAVTYETVYRIDADEHEVYYSTGTAPTVEIQAPDTSGSESTRNISGEDAAQGGALALSGGTSSTSANAGGAITLTGGTPGATGIGGAITLTSGAGGSTSGASGALTIATGTTTAGSGSATGAITIQSGAGAASAAAVAGGASGAVTLKSQNGGANTGGATGEAGGAGGAITITGGTGGATNSTGAHDGGAGASITLTAGTGGAASAGTGDGGAGGNLDLTPGSGGTSSGGTAGLTGHIRNRGVIMRTQAAPTAKTTAVTLTGAELLGEIITGTHAAGADVDYTLPTGTNMDAAAQMAVNDSFDWTLINLSAAAADTVTVTANTGHTVVGNGIVQSAHSTTGELYGNSGRFRTRKTAANTFVTYRIA